MPIDISRKQIATLNTGRDGVLREGLGLKLQRNILAKYHHEANIVTKNLIKKRQDFEHRINVCKEKQNNLLVKQDQVSRKKYFP